MLQGWVKGNEIEAAAVILAGDLVSILVNIHDYYLAFAASHE